MGFIKENREGVAMKLEGELTIYDVAKLREDLLAYVQDHDELIFDLGEVSECDTAGIQLLYSTRITAEHEGKPIEFVEISEAVTRAVTRVGMDHEDIFRAVG